MVIAISVFELHLPGARSLKSKRKVVKSLIERIHQRYRVSIAETDMHDLHQRAEIALALVAQNERQATHQLQAICTLVESEPEAMMMNWDPQILEDMA